MYNEIIFICRILRLPKKGSGIEKNIKYMMYALHFVIMMILFTLVLFKLIAVIDCASKMMMSCARGWRVISCFCYQICCIITLCFVSSKNNRRFFWFDTFCTIFTLFTNIEQETHSILFWVLILQCCFSIVFQTFKNLFNKSFL